MRFAAVMLSLLATLFAGMWIGGHSHVLPQPLADLVRDDEVGLVADAIDLINDDYYREVARERLADDAIEGMVRNRDDEFSAYFDPQEYARFREQTDARFTGVGISVVGVDDGLRIVDVYRDSPAREAGLRPGDVILRANGQGLGGRGERAATRLIRGAAGTSVELTIRRGGRTFSRRVERREVTIPVVESRRRGDVAVIALRQFSSGAHGEVYAAVRRARRRGARGIVFDLRGNGGGLVEEARLVASAFLRDGVVVRTRGRAVPEQVYRATGEPVAPDIPLVVLVDRNTASAAEIVAGALQDQDRATVVGTPTFGKGVFQEVVELGNGGALDITVGQYFTPDGRNLGRGIERGEGLRPDIRAEDDQETPRRDEALARALRELRARSS